jgi:hypothetical protein
MIEEIIGRLAERPNVVRVAISDREGLLISSVRGLAAAGTPSDVDLTDDLWNAYVAQFAANMSIHLKNITLSRPSEMLIHGTADDLLVVWLNVGWLMARATPAADWPTLRAIVRSVRDDVDALTGGPTHAEDEG